MAKFLFLAPEFAPNGVTGSIRVSKFAKYINREGHDVTVIAPETNNTTHHDLLNDLEHINIIRVSIFKMLGINDTGFQFFLLASKRSIEIAKKIKPQYIFVSGPPFFHILLACFISRTTNAKLIVDYRDLWVGDPYNPKTIKSYVYRIMSRPLERFILKRAYAVNYISNEMLEDQKKLYPFIFNSNNLNISTGYDEEDLQNINYASRYSKNFIAHIGNADIDMNLEDIVKLVLDKEVQRRLDDQSLHFLFVGQKNRVLESILPDEIRRYFHFVDYVPHLEALQLMSDCKGLILLGSNSAQRLNRKIFEYAALNSNLFFVGNSSSPTARLVKSLGCFTSTSNMIKIDFLLFLESLNRNSPNPLIAYNKINLVKKFLESLND